MAELGLEVRFKFNQTSSPVLCLKAHVPFSIQFSEINLEYRVEPLKVKKLLQMRIYWIQIPQKVSVWLFDTPGDRV